MTFYDLNEDDIKSIYAHCFEPQRVFAILEKRKLVVAGTQCTHPMDKVESINLKIGPADDGFQSLQRVYKCLSCGEAVEAIIQGFRKKQYDGEM